MTKPGRCPAIGPSPIQAQRAPSAATDPMTLPRRATRPARIASVSGSASAEPCVGYSLGWAVLCASRLAPGTGWGVGRGGLHRCCVAGSGAGALGLSGAVRRTGQRGGSAVSVQEPVGFDGNAFDRGIVFAHGLTLAGRFRQARAGRMRAPWRGGEKHRDDTPTDGRAQHGRLPDEAHLSEGALRRGRRRWRPGGTTFGRMMQGRGFDTLIVGMWLIPFAGRSASVGAVIDRAWYAA